MQNRVIRHLLPVISITFAAPFAISLAVLSLILVPTVALSQDAIEVTMIAEPAFDGTVKNGEWLPIWVELENQGPDVEAEVRVRVDSRNGTTTYAAAVSLPTKSRKRLPIYVQPNPYSRELIVWLVDRASTSASQPLIEQTVGVDSIANRTLLIGLATSERGPLADIQDTDLRDSGRRRNTNLVDLTLDELSPRTEALRSFDVLIFNDVDTSTLSADQSAAIESWVRDGGHLILGGGGNAERTAAGLPASLTPQFNSAPFELDQIDALESYAEQSSQANDEPVEPIRVVGPFVGQTATYSNRKLLAGDDDTPLLIEHALGTGTVVYSTLSLTDSPFNAWSGNQAFWQTLLSNYADYPDYLPDDISAQQQISSRISYALTQLPSLDLPSIRWLGILLICYILMVGPLNYLLLKRFRRLHWAWGTIPLLTLAFSAGAFGLGYSLRGTDLILNHIAIVEPSDDGTGQMVNYMGLFSPAEQAYELEIEGNSLITPMSQQDGRFGPVMSAGPIEVGGEMTIMNGSPGRIRGLTVNQWAMQSFQTEETWLDFGTLQGEFQLDGSELKGSLQNDLSITLEDAVVIFGNQYERLGDFASGANTDVALNLSHQDQGQLGSYIWWEVFNDESSSGPMNREADLKRQIAEAVFQIQYELPMGGSPAATQEILFLGWAPESPVDVKIAGREPIHQTKVLVHKHFPLSLPEAGHVTVPSSLMLVQLVDEPRNGGICERPNTLHMQGGSAVIEFTLPQEYQLRQIDEISLQSGYLYGDGQIPVSIAFFDWAEGNWLEANDDGAETFTTSVDPTVLLNDEGAVRVQVSATRVFENCGYFDLNISGEL